MDKPSFGVIPSGMLDAWVSSNSSLQVILWWAYVGISVCISYYLFKYILWIGSELKIKAHQDSCYISQLVFEKSFANQCFTAEKCYRNENITFKLHPSIGGPSLRSHSIKQTLSYTFCLQATVWGTRGTPVMLSRIPTAVKEQRVWEKNEQ